MIRHTFTLSETTDRLVREQLKSSSHSSLDEYVQYLVQKDLRERTAAEGALGALIDEAERSGVSERDFDELVTHVERKSGKAAGIR